MALMMQAHAALALSSNLVSRRDDAFSQAAQRRCRLHAIRNRALLKRTRTLVFAVTVLGASQAMATQPGIVDNGRFSPQVDNDNDAAVSGDGRVVTGTGGDVAYRWTAQGGYVSLGSLPNGTDSYARAVNLDGSVIVGQAYSNGLSLAFRWTQADGLVSLGSLRPGRWSDATAVNSDGTVVVGIGNISNGVEHAFRWTQATGMVDLGVLNRGGGSWGRGVSGDGSIVVGSAIDGALSTLSYRAFRWTQGTGMVSLGTLNNGTDSFANAISSDGSVIVGVANDGNAGNAARAFRWTQAGGMESLGVLAGGNNSEARAVNADGSVIVGNAASANGQNGGFRWTRATGMVTVEQWLRTFGVNAADGLTYSASGVSRDGKVVVGLLRSGGTYIARGFSPNTSPSVGGSGLIVVNEFAASLAASARPQMRMAASAGLVIDGHHSAPLRGLPGAGQRMAWASGDVGRSDHGANNAAMVNTEVGLAYGLTRDLVVKTAVGRTYDRTETPFGGRTSMRGTYVLPEVIAKLPTTPLWLSVSGFYLSGDTSIRRGYLNAGRVETGSGAPDQHVMAGRVRLDWKDAVKIGGVALTPYASFTRLNSRLEAYTETGAAWLVAWSKRQENVSESRVGLDGEVALMRGVTLLGRAEWVHRFDANTGAAAGQLLGPGGFAFDFGGQPIQKDWARFGLGLEAGLGAGTVSLTANATTQGAGPSAWLYTGYRIPF